MIMIVGGAFQGKEGYVRETYPLVPFVRGRDCSRQEVLEAQGILNLEEFFLREMKEGKSLDDLPEQVIRQNPGLIFTVREVGCGVVPVDPFERAYRETVGRTCTRLAAACERVVRLTCGVPQVIKG